MKINKVTAMELSGGGHVDIESTSGSYIESDVSWQSVGINLTRADGYTHTVAAIDYDEGSNKIVVNVYAEDSEDPAYSLMLPI